MLRAGLGQADGSQSKDAAPPAATEPAGNNGISGSDPNALTATISGNPAADATQTGTAGNGAATQGCIGADDFTCKAEAALVVYTNQIRAKVSLPPLTQNFQLCFVARDWSKKQGAAISHTGFPDARVSVFQQSFPGTAVPAISAENVAYNSSSNADPDALGKTFADQWEASPGHYFNIIGGHKSIGVGLSCPSSGSAASPSSASTGNSLGDLISSLFSSIGSGGCTGTQIFAD